MSPNFDTQEHQDRYCAIKANNWYDPNTREEVYICNLLNHYKQNDVVFRQMLSEILITNNVFLCLVNIAIDLNSNHQQIIDCFESRLNQSRITELFALTKTPWKSCHTNADHSPHIRVIDVV